MPKQPSTDRKENLFLSLRSKAEKEAAGLPALMARAEKAATSILAGEHPMRKPGTGDKFWQYREYDVSDRPQDIDWRISARGDHLYVRQKERQSSQTVLFWVQNDVSMAYRSDPDALSKHQAGVTMALGLAILLTHAHEKVGVLNSSNRPGHSEAALEQLAEELIYAETGVLPPPAVESIPENANLILIGDFLSDSAEMKSVFDTLNMRSHNVLLIQVLDPAELTLPFEGRLIFEDRQTKQQEHVHNAEAIREAYQARIKAHLDDIRALCRARQWHWILHPSDQPLRDSLFDAWQVMAHDRALAMEGAL